MLWERYTERARRVMLHAEDWAIRLKSPYISSEHIFLGLLEEEDTLAVQLLKRLGVDIQRMKTELESQLQAAIPPHAPIGPPTLIAAAKKVLVIAAEEMKFMNDSHIDTAHLLLGLLWEKQGIAAEILAKYGVCRKAVQQRLMELKAEKAEEEQPLCKPTPFAFRVQAVPLGEEGVSFQVDGVELTRYRTGREAFRPYLFPVVGPSGRWLTRMGHPHDPHGHRHHYSVWLGCAQVNGLDFWSDESGNRQVHRRFVEFGDGAEQAWCIAEIDWVTADGRCVIHERRKTAVFYPRNQPAPSKRALYRDFWWLDITSELRAAEGTVTLGPTPFGLLGVRVAKSLSVRDGGGQILNANGQINEEQAFAQPAAWCDYSGWVDEGVWEGITVFDHPDNFGHPPAWHVRDDGWFCPSHFRHQACELSPDTSKVFRYRLLVHGKMHDKIDRAIFQAIVEVLYRMFLKEACE
jgi:hypothetical protein